MADTDTEELPAISPSTPPSSTSTHEPATVDGQAPVDGPPSARPVEEIRADLATEEGQGGLTRLSPIGRLVADVPALLAELEAAHRFEQAAARDSERLAAVEALIDQARKVSPSPSMTVYVGDVEKALGRRADSVRGIRGAQS